MLFSRPQIFFQLGLDFLAGLQLKLIDTYWPLIIPAITTPVVVFIMSFLLSRYIVEGVSLGGVKG